MNPFITIKELKEKLSRKEISPQEVYTFFLERIKKYDGKINSVVEAFDDVNVPNFDATKILSGIPTLLKDNIAQKNRALTAGSNVLKGYNSPYDATVTKRIQQAGGYSIGRTNMDEFAMGGSGEYSAYGITKNPWDLSCSPGGSSSGSAAAVAAGFIPFALGTETGGSVRQPAAFCDLVGMYPTYGSHSRSGVIAFTSSTDQPGALTRTVYDNALVGSILSGHCSKDSTSLNLSPTDYTKELDGKFPDGLTLGIIEDGIDPDTIHPDILAAFEQSVAHLEKRGAKVKKIDIPHLKNGIAVYFILSRAEAASNLSRFDGTLYGNRSSEAKDLKDMYIHTRHDGFGIEVQRRILTGNYVLSSAHQGEYYSHANQVRSMIRAEFSDAFNEVDLLISPTTPTLPFSLGGVTDDPFTLYLADLFTVPNCIIGTPAISLPAGYSQEGLPIGIQFLGPRMSEKLLYKVAYAFEQSADFFEKKEPKAYE